MFCPKCGTQLPDNTEVCTNCGTKIAGQSSAVPTAAPPAAVAGRKSKTASILLAVFLSFWTWLYTYKKDGVKFWIGLAVTVAVFILSVVTFGFSGFFTWIINVAIWVWAIVDTAVKPDAWYRSY